MQNKTYFIFYGAPGSGKGTQVKLLSERLALPAISTGDLLRSEIKRGTALGREVEGLLAEGRLVSDEIVAGLVTERLKQPDAAQGAIFDGYPRRLSQQEFLLALLLEDPAVKIVPVLIEVADQEVVKRISRRRACVCGATYHLDINPPKVDGLCDRCGQPVFARDDDRPEVVAARLELYHRESQPMIDYWRSAGSLVEVDGEQPIEEVDRELMAKLKDIL